MVLKQTLSILVSAILLAACSNEKANSPESKQNTTSQVSEPAQNLPVWRVFTDPTYPPFDSKDKNGNIEGLDVDIISAIAKDQGYAVQMVPHNWEGIFKTLDKDEADIIANAVSVTDESVASADLTDSYYHTPYRIATLEPAKFDLKDWANQPKIAISATEDSSVDLPERYKVKKTQLLARDSVFLALQEVAKGNAQVVVADSTVLQFHMGSPVFTDNNIKFVSQNLPAGRGADVVFAVKKGNAELVGKINAGLANIKKSGEYERILKKWNQSLPTPQSASEVK